MPPLTPAERNAFLDAPGVLMRIATVDAQGDPHVAPIWFLHEEGRLWFTPRAMSDWLTHIRAHPRIACAIDETATPARKLVVEGEAEIVHDLGADDIWRDLYRRIAERYIPPDAAAAYIGNTIDQPRALCALPLASARIRSWRMPTGDEPRSGIWHRRYYVPGSKYGAEAGSTAE